MEKSGNVCPRIELQELGPSVDFTLRRTHLASDDFYKSACKTSKLAKVMFIPKLYYAILKQL